MDHDREIINMSAKLYERLSFSRDDVQFFITLIKSFITEYYNPTLIDTIKKNLFGVINNKDESEIEKTFNSFQDIFDKHST